MEKIYIPLATIFSEEPLPFFFELLGVLLNYFFKLGFFSYHFRSHFFVWDCFHWSHPKFYRVTGVFSQTLI